MDGGRGESLERKEATVLRRRVPLHHRNRQEHSGSVKGFARPCALSHPFLQMNSGPEGPLQHTPGTRDVQRD